LIKSVKNIDNKKKIYIYIYIYKIVKVDDLHIECNQNLNAHTTVFLKKFRVRKIHEWINLLGIFFFLGRLI